MHKYKKLLFRADDKVTHLRNFAQRQYVIVPHYNYVWESLWNNIYILIGVLLVVHGLWRELGNCLMLVQVLFIEPLCNFFEKIESTRFFSNDYITIRNIGFAREFLIDLC